MNAVDFGCGAGSWVLPLAEKLEDGKVYAVDMLEEPLSALKSKADAQNFDNIEIILSDVENGINLEDGICDLVLFTNLLFEVENKQEVMEQGKRILKTGGKILVVDWEQNSAIGPEKENRVLPEEIKKIAKKLKLKLKDEFLAGQYHYGLVFEK